jgi:hypothetical protein
MSAPWKLVPVPTRKIREQPDSRETADNGSGSPKSLSSASGCD